MNNSGTKTKQELKEQLKENQETTATLGIKVTEKTKEKSNLPHTTGMDGLNFMSNMTCIFDRLFQERQLKLLRKQLIKQDTNNVFATILCERIKAAFGLRSLPPLSEVLPIIHFDQAANTHFTLVYTSSTLNPFNHICDHFFGHEMMQLQREVYHLIYSNTLNVSDEEEDVNVDDEEGDLQSDSQIDEREPENSDEDDEEVKDGDSTHYKIEYTKPEVGMVIRKISNDHTPECQVSTDSNGLVKNSTKLKVTETLTENSKDKLQANGNGISTSASVSPASLSEESKILDLIKKSAPLHCEEGNGNNNNNSNSSNNKNTITSNNNNNNNNLINFNSNSSCTSNSMAPFLSSLKEKLPQSIIEYIQNHNCLPSEKSIASTAGVSLEQLINQPKRGPGRPRKHPGAIEKKYICEHCFKSFNVRSHLESHMVTHTGEKKYTCKYCGNKFTQSSSLRNHVIAIHTRNFPHVCSYCRKGFLLPSQLKKHKTLCIRAKISHFENSQVTA